MSLTPAALLEIVEACDRILPHLTGDQERIVLQLREICFDTAITIRRLEQEIELLKHGQTP